MGRFLAIIGIFWLKKPVFWLFLGLSTLIHSTITWLLDKIG
jgi:hypothetical protein